MRISFIGSGNVATHLALAFYGCGHVVEQVWSRNIDHANLLAARVEAQPVSDLGKLLGNADAYILAIPDDVLFELAGDLRLGNALLLHTSGATPIEVLKHCSTRYGVLWAPQSFVRDAAMDYSELPFCIEGSDPKAEEEIAALAGTVSSHIYRTSLGQRQYLHLAAVFVNNFTNGLYAVAQQVCREQDVPFEILYPIIQTTARKAQWGDVRYQLTGPAVRNDRKTIDAHRRLLAHDRQMLEVYDLMTELVQKIKHG